LFCSLQTGSATTTAGATTTNPLDHCKRLRRTHSTTVRDCDEPTRPLDCRPTHEATTEARPTNPQPRTRLFNVSNSASTMVLSSQKDSNLALTRAGCSAEKKGR
jgi:hypothetical protein